MLITRAIDKMKAYLFLIVILAYSALADSTGNGDLDRPWWRLVAINQEQDAAVSVKFELRFPYKMELIENIEVYCGFTPWARDKTARKYGPRELYKVYPAVEDGRVTLSVRSQRMEQVEIWARVKTAERLDFAGTAYNAYGKAPQADVRPERLAEAPDWPALNLAVGHNFYRAQTGAKLVLQPDPGFLPDSVKVFEDGRLSAVLKAENEKYSYTPPHDEELSKRGPAARKDLIFLAEPADSHEAVTFYLPLYRSHYGYINLPGGLLVIFIGAFGALAVVLLMNRAFRWR